MTPLTSTLLTGSTGLVGRFLLAALMRRRLPTLVLVRKQARQRIGNRIDEALAPFETECNLPRPIILEGDLTKPGLGLSSESRDLLKRQRLRILHSAASIRFQAEQPDGEPFLTNVFGTKNLLQEASGWNVEQWHHVSTAYVQCDRSTSRTAMETAVDSSFPSGNDYEQSKIVSEELVSKCPDIGQRTFYRPSIVVGDSQNGYTSTFHGFYAPLQIAAQLARSSGFDWRAGDIFREHLGMKANDSKNLVPVDWVAEAVLTLMENPRAWGGIYHLTHDRPASLRDIQSAILEALVAQFPQRPAANNPVRDQLNPDHFREAMAVYDSYFANDPSFDRTKSASLLMDLPCPAMDLPMLRRLADFALKANFGWPRPSVPYPPSRRLTFAVPRSPALSTNLIGTEIELEIIGRTGLIQEQRSSKIQHSLQRFRRTALGWVRLDDAETLGGMVVGMRLVASEQALDDCLTQKIDPAQLFERGQWLIQGFRPVYWLEIVRDWVQHLTMEPLGLPTD